VSLVQLSVSGTRREIEGVTRKLADQLSGFEVRPVRQIAAAEGTILGRIQGLIFWTIALILILSMLGVLASMAALAMERRRDVGLMKALGGTVLRQSRADFEHEQIRQGVEADKAELAELGAEYRQATDEQKAKLKAKIDETRAKLRTARERAKAKQKQLRQETDAKIKVLQEQRAKAKADAKARLDQRIDAFGKDYDRRADQLIEAAALADDALTP
jgi:Skp family chaperone for outer membrane proteins